MSSPFKRNNLIIAFSNRCVETYALYAQVLNDQQVETLWSIYQYVIQLLCNVYLCDCSCQEFDRADALYQQGMKVDPGNANLLVRKLSYINENGHFDISPLLTRYIGAWWRCSPRVMLTLQWSLYHR